MNHKQFIVFSYFLFILSGISIVNGLDHFVWLVVGIAAIFGWLIYLLADRFDGKRLAILRATLGYPLLIMFLGGAGYWGWKLLRTHGSNNAFPLPYYESKNLTGNASLTYSNLSGSIYNGSTWQIKKLVLSVKDRTQTRKFDYITSIKPNEAVSFSIFTGIDSNYNNSGAKTQWNIENSFGIELDHQPRSLNDEEQKTVNLVNQLLQMSPQERLAFWTNHRKGKSYDTIFELVTSTKEVISNEYLKMSIAEEYEEARDFGTEVAFLQELWPSKTDYARRIGHDYAKALRGLRHYRQSIRVSEDSILMPPKESQWVAGLWIDQAIGWEYTGNIIRAIRCWQKAAQLIDEPNTPSNKQNTYADSLFIYSDRELIGFTKDEITSDFIRARIQHLHLILVSEIVIAILFVGALGALLFYRKNSVTQMVSKPFRQKGGA